MVNHDSKSDLPLVVLQIRKSMKLQKRKSMKLQKSKSMKLQARLHSNMKV